MKARVTASILIAIIVIAAVAGLYVAGYLGTGAGPPVPGGSGSSTIRVVAAENFWGSLASQLGGSHVQVVSIVSDPKADPHAYETNPKNATAVAEANLVIENGAGYDNWIEKLVSASNTPNQKVLNVADVVGYKQGDLAHFSNEHFWYNPTFVNKTVNAIYKDYVSLDSANAAYYQQQYKALNASLYKYMSLEAKIKAQYGGTTVAATETIFLYMANATGLKVVSPFGFMTANAEGESPSARDVATFQDQLKQPGLVKMLVVNSQTVTPLTDGMRDIAAQQKIPVVSVSETPQPANVAFQDWMMKELTDIQNALSGH